MGNKEIYEIPEDIKTMCKDLAAVAQKHRLSSLSGQFRTGFLHPFTRNVQFTWNSGRHNEDANEINIQTEFKITEKINSF